MNRTVLIADDHPLFREALHLSVLQAMPGAQIAEADSVDSLFAQLEQHRDLELLLLDLNMPGAQGFSALIQARSHFPAVPVIVISGREEPHIVSRTIAHGAAGFIPKSSSSATIVEAIRAVLSGDVWTSPGAQSTSNHVVLDDAEQDAAARVATLTPQQFRVLSMLLAGMLNKQMAAELKVSEATIKAHMTAILQKLGVSNRTQAVLFAQRLAVEMPNDHAASH